MVFKDGAIASRKKRASKSAAAGNGAQELHLDTPFLSSAMAVDSVATPAGAEPVSAATDDAPVAADSGAAEAPESGASSDSNADSNKAAPDATAADAAVRKGAASGSCSLAVAAADAAMPDAPAAGDGGAAPNGTTDSSPAAAAAAAGAVTGNNGASAADTAARTSAGEGGAAPGARTTRRTSSGEAGTSAGGSSAPAVNLQQSPNEEDVARVDLVLKKYQARVEQLVKQARAKPDMVTCKELGPQLTPARCHGHIPGVTVGRVFNGRGELAILNIHGQILRGIDVVGDAPAYAIVLSGGYKDDRDEGSSFWYTGEGGQKAGKQVTDQTWTKGNLALKRSFETGTPVRVCRAKKGDDSKARLYCYEGLYKVTDAKLVDSADGPKVCQFRMEGLPGHSVHSTTVTHGIFGGKGSRYQRVSLADSTRTPRAQRAGRKSAGGTGSSVGRQPKTRERKEKGAKRSRSDVNFASHEASLAYYRQPANRQHLILDDISGGQERLPIPVFNSVDDAPAPNAFGYVAEYEFVDDEQRDSILDMIDEATQAFKQTRINVVTSRAAAEASTSAAAAPDAAELERRAECGLAFMGEACYNEDGCLMSTNPAGILECDPEVCSNPACRGNAVVSRGIALPLEVFRTAGKGWGVRSPRSIPIGAYVCSYIGVVLTEKKAEAKWKIRDGDEYLFNLDHFTQIYDDLERATDQTEPPEVLAALPPLTEAQRKDHLVIDAREKGNVARFINHSCEPNLTMQTVFLGPCKSGVLFYNALFAQENIPAYAELSYDYKYKIKDVDTAGKVPVTCMCGTPKCRAIFRYKADDSGLARGPEDSDCCSP